MIIEKIKAWIYALFHGEPVQLVVVRRYIDAQGRFIGELYMGEGRPAVQIGMSCDTMPFTAGDDKPPKTLFRLEFNGDFLSPMGPDGLRVGAQAPAENEAVRQIVSLRRYCKLSVRVLNRFIEHIMEQPPTNKGADRG